MNTKSMSAAELRAAITLSMVFFLRMLPLFMVLPVLAMAGDNYSSATPELLGLALGINGLTQACLQIPFGMLSDRYGRKLIISIGLGMFVAGSLLAGFSDSVYGLIAGRALQGAGAVSAASMALAADLSREDTRTRMMALIGISIGLAFPIAFIIGPLLFSSIGLNGLFFIGAVCGVVAISLLLFVVPTPQALTARTRLRWSDVTRLVKTPYLLKLDISIFITHLLLMANFVVIPIAFRDVAGVATNEHWKMYLLVLGASLLITVPLILLGERLKKVSVFFVSSIIMLILSQAGFYLFAPTVMSLVLLLILFFGAFNYLEALLPSEISKNIEPGLKGTALGIYSASQFIGIFCGGAAGGLLYKYGGMNGVHLFSLGLTVAWLLLVLALPNTGALASKNRLEEETV
ncbi:MAG: MFS transporter [Gammaproteobacteria bacterium]